VILSLLLHKVELDWQKRMALTISALDAV